MSATPTAATADATATERVQQHRRYLMCRPEHFTVSYSINPWMEPSRPTDTPSPCGSGRRCTTPTCRSGTRSN